jgi:copper(I)-binding protein
MKKTTILMAALATLSLGVSACSSDTESADTTVAPMDDSFVIDGAWARPSPTESTVGAAYMNITSPADDALVGASVDLSVAMMAQVHETTTAADGTMGMKEIGTIPMSAGTPLALAPGGYHIMIMELAKPLEVGSSFNVTLTFASGATTTVEVPVQNEAP